MPASRMRRQGESRSSISSIFSFSSVKAKARLLESNRASSVAHGSSGNYRLERPRDEPFRPLAPPFRAGPEELFPRAELFLAVRPPDFLPPAFAVDFLAPLFEPRLVLFFFAPADFRPAEVLRPLEALLPPGFFFDPLLAEDVEPPRLPELELLEVERLAPLVEPAPLKLALPLPGLPAVPDEPKPDDPVRPDWLDPAAVLPKPLLPGVVPVRSLAFAPNTMIRVLWSSIGNRPSSLACFMTP